MRNYHEVALVVSHSDSRRNAVYRGSISAYEYMDMCLIILRHPWSLHMSPAGIAMDPISLHVLRTLYTTYSWQVRALG